MPKIQKQKLVRKRSSTRTLDNINEYDNEINFVNQINKEKTVKKKYSRSRSDGQFNKRRQLDEVTSEINPIIGLVDEDEYEYQPPKYEMRTSNAGTLLVKRYSFTPSTRRRSLRENSLGRTSSASSIPSITSLRSTTSDQTIKSIFKSVSSGGVYKTVGSDTRGVVLGDGGGSIAREFKDERGRKRRERSRSRARSIERDRDRYPDAGSTVSTTSATTTAATPALGSDSVRRNRDRGTADDEVLQRMKENLKTKLISFKSGTN